MHESNVPDPSSSDYDVFDPANSPVPWASKADVRGSRYDIVHRQTDGEYLGEIAEAWREHADRIVTNHEGQRHYRQWMIQELITAAEVPGWDVAGHVIDEAIARYEAGETAGT